MPKTSIKITEKKAVKVTGKSKKEVMAALNKSMAKQLVKVKDGSSIIIVTKLIVVTTVA